MTPINSRRGAPQEWVSISSPIRSTSRALSPLHRQTEVCEILGEPLEEKEGRVKRRLQIKCRVLKSEKKLCDNECLVMILL